MCSLRHTPDTVRGADVVYVVMAMVVMAMAGNVFVFDHHLFVVMFVNVTGKQFTITISDEVVKARPWSQGSLRPHFMALALALVLALKIQALASTAALTR